jgi:hypothetical protein
MYHQTSGMARLSNSLVFYIIISFGDRHHNLEISRIACRGGAEFRPGEAICHVSQNMVIFFLKILTPFPKRGICEGGPHSGI